MSRYSRRNFLRVMAGAVGSLAIPRIAFTQDAPSKFDVAIVGGGVSGLFCALRLRAAGFNVALFEASDRIGGRVLSVFLPGFTTHAVELGAMRLRATDSVAIKLIETLLGADAKIPFDYPTRAWFLRDRLLRTLDDPAKLPYGFDSTERAIVASGKSLLFETIREMEAASESIGLASARNQGVWEQALKIRSKEGLNFLVDSGGYNTLTTNWNVAAAIPWYINQLAEGGRYFTVSGGLQRLPNAIADAYARNGGPIYTKHPLRAIKRADDGGMVLTFGAASGLRQVSAGRVILAMTPAAIQELDPDSFILRDGRFRSALKSLIRVAMAKINLSFNKPWWEAAGFGTWRAVTDLPVRQTFFWGKDPKTGKGATLASYHDGPAMEFWSALDTGAALGSPGWIKEARGANGSPLPASLAKTLPVSRLMAEEAWRQLKQAYVSPDSALQPIHGVYYNWAKDPSYGAAFHLWAIGADAENTLNFMREPFPGIYVCGEAWSREQGWINGATSTAETVLQEKFGLPPYLST